MRPRLLHFVVGVVVVTAPLLPSTAGAESDASRARSWDRMIEPSAAARHRALADRRLERSRRTDPSAATGRAQSGVRDVRPVSRDTLQGPRPAENDTQVEPSIAADPNPPSPHDGPLYAVWDQEHHSFQGEFTGAPVLLRYSDDQGLHWSDQIHLTGPKTYGLGALPEVQPNGDLTVLYQTYVPDFSEPSS